MQHAHFEVLRSVLFAQKYWKIPTRYFPNLAHTVCNACCLFQLRTGASHAFSKTKRRRRLLGLLLRRAPGDATANTWTGGAWPTGTKRGEGLRRVRRLLVLWLKSSRKQTLCHSTCSCMPPAQWLMTHACSCPLCRWTSKLTCRCTPGKINMEPENGPLEDYFPLQPGGSSVSMLASSRV